MYKIPANTLFLGKNLIFVPECHSTSSLALDLCQQSCPPEGTLVITHDQTAGRGQRGNTWESAPGMNLTFSLVLKPAFLAVKNQFLLSIIASLAIQDYVASTCGTAASIKWPNDILINQFKICGILIENQLAGERLNYAVIGIGFNVNQRHFQTLNATSLAIMLDKNYDLQMVLEGILGSLEVQYLRLREGKILDLRRDYLSHLYRINQLSTFRSGDKLFQGKIAGVDEDGKLCVSIEGVEKTFDVKEISLLKIEKIRSDE